MPKFFRVEKSNPDLAHLKSFFVISNPHEWQHRWYIEILSIPGRIQNPPGKVID
ncbi:MAG: hypothetical protein P1V20_30175 [Verrucomicrobiales bacterium]|nr:hypothetical protein [Verrucomicrobiales bacterium]